MKRFTVAAAYALWLLTTEVVFYLLHGQVHGQAGTALEAAILLGIVPLTLQLLLLGLNPLGLVAPMKLALAFVLLALLSYVFNGGGWAQVTFMVELLYLCTLAVVVAGCPDTRMLRLAAAIFSVVSSLFLAYVDATGEHLWGRLYANDIESNWWGLMGLGAAITAFAIESRLLAFACLGVGYYTIYDASNRGSLVGLGAALLVFSVWYVVRLRNQRLLAAVGLAGVLLVLAAVLSPYLGTAVPDFFSDLFKLNDPYRGIGQGFTGRDELWEAALDLWRKSPLFGVGFRMHEQFLPYQMSAHNAYLAMLADTGVFGLIWYIGLMVGSLRASLSIPDDRSRILAIMVIMSYAVIGLFERRAINGGNPVSVFFLMFSFYALTQEQLRRALPGGGRDEMLPARPAEAA